MSQLLTGCKKKSLFLVNKVQFEESTPLVSTRITVSHHITEHFKVVLFVKIFAIKTNSVFDENQFFVFFFTVIGGSITLQSY